MMKNSLRELIKPLKHVVIYYWLVHYSGWQAIFFKEFLNPFDVDIFAMVYFLGQSDLPIN